MPRKKKQPEVQDDEILAQEEEAKLEGLEQLEEMRVVQEINDAIANVPTVFEIDGERIEVKSKPIRQMVLIDKAILRLTYLLSNPIIPTSEDELERCEQQVQEVYKLITDIVFMIINDDYDNPRFTREWIEEKMRLREDVWEQIIDAYKAHCSPVPLLRKIAEARRF